MFNTSFSISEVALTSYFAVCYQSEMQFGKSPRARTGWLLRTAVACAALLGLAFVPASVRQARAPIIVDVPYSLSYGVTIGLPSDWVQQEQGPPPSPLLTGSAPPLRFETKISFENTPKRSLLEAGISNNIFLGRDSYWLDEQMHSSNNSGLSLPDFLFYFFFPPPHSCLAASTDAYAGTSRAPVEEGDPDIEVRLDCHFSPTISDFYASQVGPAVILRQTEDGLRAMGVVNDFYRAPMEELTFSGMTFYVLEARAPEGIAEDVAQRFQLPPELAGGQTDYFWAIGAKTPFPFVSNAATKDARLIHLTYATISRSGGAHDDFVGLLHRIRAQ